MTDTTRNANRREFMKAAACGLTGLGLCALLGCRSAAAAATRPGKDALSPLPGETVFDVPALIATPLRPRTLKRAEKGAIVTEEVTFHSETDGTKQVEIFAYFSYPKGGRKLPAFIWNPGGLSQANTIWTEPGAKRGYAVLCLDFPQPGYRSRGNYPINTGLDLGDDPRKAPIYHGAVALLKAVSYLQSRPEVDQERIGMGGSSWGGFFTTLMIGVDPRLKAGACLYGTGNLQLGNAWWDGQNRHGRASPGPAEREHWRKTLDPGWRLQYRQTPIAWLTGTNDGFYPMPAVMKTYDMAAGPKHLTLLPNWDHALPPRFHDEQVYSWLDVYLKGRSAFPRPTPVDVTRDGDRLTAGWTFRGGAVAADLIVSYGDAGNWRGRYWHTFKAEINGNMCRAAWPAGPLPCYVSGSVSDQNGFRYSTPLRRVDPAALGVKTPTRLPDYNGCAEWGDFEDPQVAFLVRHDRSGQARWIPRRSTDARTGKYSAVLNPGRTVLPPILSTALVRHRFRCYLKAAKPVEVTLQLGGEHRRFRVATEWLAVTSEFTPPAALMGGIPASITVPPGAAVLVDAVSFRPVLGGR